VAFGRYVSDIKILGESLGVGRQVSCCSVMRVVLLQSRNEGRLLRTVVVSFKRSPSLQIVTHKFRRKRCFDDCNLSFQLFQARLRVVGDLLLYECLELIFRQKQRVVSRKKDRKGGI
jgi:hypothetical protein